MAPPRTGSVKTRPPRRARLTSTQVLIFATAARVSRETVRRWARGGRVSHDNDIRLGLELAREALVAVEHSLDQLCRSEDKEHNVAALAALDDVRALLGWTPLKDGEAQHRRRVREALLKIGTRETMASLQAMGDVSCLQARVDN